jgi:protein tyrosine phosphatase
MASDDLSWIDDAICIGRGGLVAMFSELKKKGLGLVINLEKAFHSEEEKASKKIGLDYLYCPVKDYTAPTQDQLDMVVAKMRDAVDSGKKVYIHCGAGHGRSPTFVAAYLISRCKTMAEAIEIVKKKRPSVWISSGDIQGRDGALPEFERRKKSGELKFPICK